MEKIEQIKAEIKRKYKSYEKILNENINPFLSFSLVSRIEECKSVLSFIDSLEEPISEDLEQAAVEAFKKIVDDGDNSFLNIFKAGAQWQKQQDQLTIELAEDHAMLAGMEKMRQEMIDKVCKWLVKHWREYVWLTDNDVIHFGHWEHDFKKAMEE